MSDLAQRLDKLEGRVDRIEHWRSWVTGGVVVIGVLFAAALNIQAVWPVP